MDRFAEELKNNGSKCLDCDEFRWCPYKVWIGQPKNCYYQANHVIDVSDLGKNKRSFKLTLPTSILRGMDRQQYYSIMHYLRWCAWKMNKRINWENFDKQLTNGLLYGYSVSEQIDKL